MSKVWALVFLSLLLIEPSASLALAEDSGASLKSSSSGSSGDDDDNKTDGGSGSMGKPQPMQIGAGVVLGLLVGAVVRRPEPREEGQDQAPPARMIRRKKKKERNLKVVKRMTAWACLMDCSARTTTRTKPLRHTRSRRRPQRNTPRSTINFLMRSCEFAATLFVREHLL